MWTWPDIAAGMPARWSGATFGAEPCSQKTTEQRQTDRGDDRLASCHCPAVRYNETSAQDSVSPLVKTDISSKPDLQPFKLPVCLHQKCLSDGRIAPEAPTPPSLPPQRSDVWIETDKFCNFLKPTI